MIFLILPAQGQELRYGSLAYDWDYYKKTTSEDQHVPLAYINSLSQRAEDALELGNFDRATKCSQFLYELISTGGPFGIAKRLPTQKESAAITNAASVVSAIFLNQQYYFHNTNRILDSIGDFIKPSYRLTYEGVNEKHFFNLVQSLLVSGGSHSPAALRNFFNAHYGDWPYEATDIPQEGQIKHQSRYNKIYEQKPFSPFHYKEGKAMFTDPYGYDYWVIRTAADGKCYFHATTPEGRFKEKEFFNFLDDPSNEDSLFECYAKGPVGFGSKFKYVFNEKIDGLELVYVDNDKTLEQEKHELREECKKNRPAA